MGIEWASSAVTWVFRNWQRSPCSRYSITTQKGSSRQQAPNTRAILRSSSAARIRTSLWKSSLKPIQRSWKLLLYTTCTAITRCIDVEEEVYIYIYGGMTSTTFVRRCVQVNGVRETKWICLSRAWIAGAILHMVRRIFRFGGECCGFIGYYPNLSEKLVNVNFS